MISLACPVPQLHLTMLEQQVSFFKASQLSGHYWDVLRGLKRLLNRSELCFFEGELHKIRQLVLNII